MKFRTALPAIRRFLLLTAGALLAAVGLEIFLIPNEIIDGGVVGISILASHLTGWQLGIFTFTLNAPFFVLGYRQIGRTFFLSTLYAVCCLSLFVTILHPVPGLTKDVFLATVFGGVIDGLGVGLIIRNGGSLDGTEIVAIILDKKSGFSIGEIVMLFNLFILSAAGFVFGWDKAMYSLVAYFIVFKAIDIVVEGVDESKAVMIISDQYDDITSAVAAQLGRTGTILEGRGGYSRNETSVLYIVVSRLEIAKLKAVVLGCDPNALITVGNVEVSGKKYVKKAIH